jgi:hypothetical protein
MKIKELLESQEKSLVGMKIDGKIPPVEGKWKGDFICSGNNLMSLEGAPSSIDGDFYCYHNQLTSLKGAPSSVGGDFYCYNNQLTSLEGASPSVGGDFYCSNNQLTSLKDVHKQIKKIGGVFSCSNNPIKSHVLGLLLIDGLTEIRGALSEDGNGKWIYILNQAIKQFDDKRKRVMWAQSELINHLGEEGKALAQL